MSISLRKNVSTPTVHEDSFGRFQVITEHGACWSPDPPTVREVHEAHARQLQREALTQAGQQVSAWLRRAIRSGLHRRAADAADGRPGSERLSLLHTR